MVADAPPATIKASELAEHYGLRRVHAVVFVASFLTIAVQATVVGPAPLLIDSVKHEFAVSDSAASCLATLVLGGSAIGVCVFGRLIDVLGRRKGMIIYTLLLILLSLLHLAIPETTGFQCLVCLRLLIAIPYGGVLVNQYSYLAEFLPDNARGAMAAATNLGWHMCHLYMLPFIPMYSIDAPWRKILAFLPIGPGVLCLLALLWAPESPRWLLTGGYEVEAQESLSTIFASPPVYGAASVGSAPSVDTSELSGKSAYGITQETTMKTVQLLLSPGLRAVTCITCLLYFVTAGASNVAWTWAPLLISQAAGHKPERNIFMGAEATGAFGVLVAMCLIDRVSRKGLIFWLFTLKAFLTAILLRDHGPEGTMVPFYIWPMTLVVSSAIWPVVVVYLTEAFPTGVRGTGSGFAMLGGRTAAMVLPALAGMEIRQNYKVVLYSVVVLYCIGAIMALAIPKETSCLPINDVVDEVGKGEKKSSAASAMA
jgi:MFS family permease